MDPKLLLDENLSPTIGVRLRAEGIDVCHVRDRGLLGASDGAVFNRALEEDRILITLNVGDFESIASDYFVHIGVVLVERIDLSRDEQFQMVVSVVEALRAHGDLVNEVMYVRTDGTFSFEPRSKPLAH